MQVHSSNSYYLFTHNQSKSNPQESSTTNSAQRGEIEKKITDMLQRGFEEDEEITLYVSRQMHPKLIEDGNTQLENLMKKLESLKNDAPLPTESEFQASLDFLTKEIHSILTNFYEKQPDSEEFRNLLGFAINATTQTKERENAKERLLDTLNQAQRDPEFAKSQEFMDKLLLRFYSSTIKESEIDAFKAMNEKYGNLISYTTANALLGSYLEDFFRLANLFDAIPQSSQARIQDSLQSAQRYLYNQSGDIDNSFKVGDFVIAFEGDPIRTNVFMDGGSFSISYQKPDDILLSLASSFDSSQTFFEVLEQRDKLEKQNQELKSKQASIAYGIPQNNFTKSQRDSTDSIMQTLLKESKESRKA